MFVSQSEKISLDEVVSLQEIKRLFFETPLDSEDQVEKKYDMIELIEETFPEINFTFGRKDNTIASEELRSWCVASGDPKAALSDIQHIKPRKGRCDACNLSRVVSHQVRPKCARFVDSIACISQLSL